MCSESYHRFGAFFVSKIDIYFWLSIVFIHSGWPFIFEACRVFKIYVHVLRIIIYT